MAQELNYLLCTINNKSNFLNFRIMKKVFFTVVLVMGLGTLTAFAENMKTTTESMIMVNEFEPIDIKELPQAIQDVIKQSYSELTIKSASVEAKEDGTKTYKVVLIDNMQTETEVLFNEKGEVLK